MSFVAGERICARTTCDDGFPIVRYGTVNAVVAANGPLIVVFDDDMGANLVDLSEVEILSITSISLVLSGVDLADDPDLQSPRGRAARVLLWLMEQDQAIRLISVG